MFGRHDLLAKKIIVRINHRTRTSAGSKNDYFFLYPLRF